MDPLPLTDPLPTEVPARVTKSTSPSLFPTSDQIADALFAMSSGASDQGRAARGEMLAYLKQVHADGRSAIETALIEDGKGSRCAVRLSQLQDNILRALFAVAAGQLYRAVNPSSAEQLSILAVGGYGRGTLAPGSDIDLLFLLPYKQTAWGESVVEFILYMLWDLGLKVGHATRGVDECIRLCKSDMTIRTAVLDTRFLIGDTGLYEELQTRYRKEFQRGRSTDFIEAKMAERDARHDRGGQSRYLVEPNIKEGKGGLRDLNTLYWLATYHYGVDSLSDLIEQGVMTKAEVNLFRRCESFLWAVRCHLHFATGRAEERLSFDIQALMAERLGYTSHPGLRQVERFMKHYFLVAKDVGDLTRILCAGLEMAHVKPTAGLSRFLPTFKSSRRTPKLKNADGFAVESGRLTIVDDGVFERDPAQLINMFEVADRHNLRFHPVALRRARASLKLIDGRLRDDPAVNARFLDIVTSKRDPEAVLRRMNEAGVLGRFLPDFGKIVAMMQFNLYHHYTVDEHLLRSIGILSDIEHGRAEDTHPFSTSLMKDVEDRRILFVALLLHDIAKGRPEDHSIAGARVARRICPRLGLDAGQTELVAWLIERHLTMSIVAQSRDLSDIRTIEDFATIVQDRERLKLLLILTSVDIDAVGPGTWNDWKASLLRTLYEETETILTGGHTRTARAQRVSSSRQELRDALTDWSEERFERYAERHYPAYWIRTDLNRRIADAHFLDAIAPGDKDPQARTDLDPESGFTELTVYVPDHPRLLSMLAGACMAAGVNIVDAQVFTTRDGSAFDIVRLSREFGDEDELRRAEKIIDIFGSVLRGETELGDLIARKDVRRGRLKAFRLQPKVTITNDLSDRFTVIEVSGLDRPGLLHALTGELAMLQLDITSARVATFGERAVDVFYVTDLTGQKITSAGRIKKIRDAMTQVMTPPQKAVA
jgi:[protein-PII] uridylyltransferase